MGEARHCPPNAQASGGKGGGRVVEGWEKPGNAHPMPRLQVGKVGEGCSKAGESQAKPTYHPGFRQERRGKGGRNLAINKPKNALPLHGKAFFSFRFLFLH